MYVSYFALFRYKPDHTSVVWNSITSTDANKRERIQRNLAALYFNIFFTQVHYSYDLALKQLKLQTLRKRRYYLDALFLIQVYLGSIFCPSVLDTVGLRAPVRLSETFYVQFMLFPSGGRDIEKTKKKVEGDATILETGTGDTPNP
jgi:hypothetical protein